MEKLQLLFPLATGTGFQGFFGLNKSNLFVQHLPFITSNEPCGELQSIIT